MFSVTSGGRSYNMIVIRLALCGPNTPYYLYKEAPNFTSASHSYHDSLEGHLSFEVDGVMQ
jgi:hypothetical protein